MKLSGEAAFNGLKTIIVEGQALGVFKPGDIELLALTTWSGIHGLTLLLVSGNLPDPARNAKVTVLRLKWYK